MGYLDIFSDFMKNIIPGYVMLCLLVSASGQWVIRFKTGT